MNNNSVKKGTGVSQSDISRLLVSNHSPFWTSTLFNETYLANDVPERYEELSSSIDDLDFVNFCENFRNICDVLRTENLHSWSERNTINRFIKPVLKMLGYAKHDAPEPWAEDEPFSISENGETKIYKPDLTFVNDYRELRYFETKKGFNKLNEARSSVFLVLEAKYWGRIDEQIDVLDVHGQRNDKKEEKDSARSLDFDGQCLKYMEILGLDYGILTDGKTWRLYHKDLSSDTYRRFFQFNLGHLMRHVNAGMDTDKRDYQVFVDNARYFYYIFAKQSLWSGASESRLVDDLTADSLKYASSIEEDLKQRFLKAMTFACDGLAKTSLVKNNTRLLSILRRVAENHIFNILFLKHCEARSILPLTRAAGYRKLSLSNTIDKLHQFNPDREEDGLNDIALKANFAGDFEYQSQGTELYERLLALIKIIEEGYFDTDSEFKIDGFVSDIFTEEEWAYAQCHKLSNSAMVQILFTLGYCVSESPGKRYQQISYNFFSPQQLGSIYESFLEFDLKCATTDMIFQRGKWAVANLSSSKVQKLDVPKIRAGSFYFTADNSARKTTGSFYTPHCVVDFIVHQTLHPICRGKSSAGILNLKICDPAMGSGHFLSGALNYLARAYLYQLDVESNDDLRISIAEAKQQILENCLYGVDINPRAVKLAKLSLWMESASSRSPLKNMGGRLRSGDSILSQNIWKQFDVAEGEIDAVVGNPPYLGEKGHKEVFRLLRLSSLGQRFYQHRMDLYYFFIHLALDLLRTGGRMGIITTNYFPTATGATQLRTDLQTRSSLALLMDLNHVKVFGDAAGQHNMITILTRGHLDESCVTVKTKERCRVSSNLLTSLLGGVKSTIRDVQHEELFEGAERYIRLGTHLEDLGDMAKISSVLSKMKRKTTPMGEFYNVNQGIITGADKISKKHVKSFDVSANLGDGVFVLNQLEAARLGDNKITQPFLRPWYKNSDIGKYTTADNSQEYVLYLNHMKHNQQTLPKSIKNHLEKFQTIISNSVSKPPFLHRARKEKIFVGAKIVAPQRSLDATFAYNEHEWFASADVYFITGGLTEAPSLKVLLGLLNSTLYFAWFYFMGKKKGEMLELYQKPLSETPIPEIPSQIAEIIEVAVTALLSDPRNQTLRSAVDDQVCALFGISIEEKQALKILYETRQTKREKVAEA